MILNFAFTLEVPNKFFFLNEFSITLKVDHCIQFPTVILCCLIALKGLQKLFSLGLWSTHAHI